MPKKTNEKHADHLNAQGRWNMTKVATLTSKGKKYVKYFDPGMKGLHLRVVNPKPPCVGTWAFDFFNKYRWDEKKKVLGMWDQVSLGRLGNPAAPTITVEQARKKAEAILAIVEHDKKDPKADAADAKADADADPQSTSGVLSMGQLVLARAGDRKFRTIRQYKATLQRYSRYFDWDENPKDVRPLLSMPSNEFDGEQYKKFAARWLDSEKPMYDAALKFFNDINALLNFGLGMGVKQSGLAFNPLQKVKPPKNPEEKPIHYLTLDEIELLWRLVDDATPFQFFGPVLKLQLCFASRIGEVAKMRRSQIRKEDGVWIWEQPDIYVKNKRNFLVPINELAMEIIDRRLFDMRGTPFDVMWPGEDPNKHRVTQNYGRLLANCFETSPEQPHMTLPGIRRFTSHDLRHTVTTHCSLKRNGLKEAKKYMGHVMNHKSAKKKESGDIAAKHYNANEYLDEKMDALYEWSDFLKMVISGGRPKEITRRSQPQLRLVA